MMNPPPASAAPTASKSRPKPAADKAPWRPQPWWLVYGVVTAGAENDLQQVTEVARHMVLRWGMSEKLGPISHALLEAESLNEKEIRDVTGLTEPPRLEDADETMTTTRTDADVESWENEGGYAWHRPSGVCVGGGRGGRSTPGTTPASRASTRLAFTAPTGRGNRSSPAPPGGNHDRC